MQRTPFFLSSILCFLASLLIGCDKNANVKVGSASADANHAPARQADPNDWYRWRGPEQNGVSRQKNLPSEWEPPTPQNPQGKNLIWTNDVGGMSSP
ncbi:MAG TPA: hypothetical protein VGP99_07025, partial [Tepidisphaeraceae bacterium]|nr:hypothetical protein [Tepidisphaeraceae bacterium]